VSDEVYQLFEMRGDGDMRPIGTPYPTIIQCDQLKYAVVSIIRKMLPENPQSAMAIAAPGGVMPVDVTSMATDYSIYRQVEDGWEQI